VSGAGDVLALPLDELLPHRDPMILLTRVLGERGADFVAEVDIGAASPFFDGRGVPGWIALEYMAQTVAAFAGVEGAREGGGVRPGLLLGARVFTCARERFLEGETLSVAVRRILRQDNGITAMDCWVRDSAGAELAQAQLTLIQLPDMAALKELTRR
jgi:predicted hotdog family 3-hydroxylacyl-ACP dehydratase